MKNMCCNKKTCSCNKTVKYCGSYLACSGIENGESFDEVVKKLNAIACDYASTEYSFLVNEECENGGFIVKNEEQETVFTYCSPPNCGSFYISNHIIDEGNRTDDITFNVEGGSGSYTFDFQRTEILVGNGVEISYDENLGEIMVSHYQEGVEIFFLVTVKDNVTGCVAQYPLYLKRIV